MVKKAKNNLHPIKLNLPVIYGKKNTQGIKVTRNKNMFALDRKKIVLVLPLQARRYYRRCG